MVKISTSAPSPLSPTLWPAKAFVWWQSLLFAVALFLTALLAAFAFGIAWAVAFGLASLKNPSTGFLLVAQCASYVPVLILALYVLPRLAQRSLRELGLRAPTWAEVGWGILGSAAMFLVSGAIGGFEEHVLHQKVQESAVDLLKSVHGPLAFLFAFIACVLAPIVEELVFRAFLFNALLRYSPVAIAAVVSALVFGIAHGSPTAFAPLAGAGLVLAVVYYRTGALGASMIAHAGFNAIAVIGFFVFKTA